MLHIKDIFKLRSQLTFPSLPVSFSAREGEHLWVNGLNGSGKTTLLEILAGHLTHEGYCSQYNHLYIPAQYQFDYTWTVSDCIHLFIFLHKSTHSLQFIIDEIRLEANKNQSIRTLSKGQLQRLLLSQLLMSNSKIWLLDEPFLGLDLKSSIDLKEWISIHLKNKGIVIEAGPLWSHEYQPSQTVLMNRVGD